MILVGLLAYVGKSIWATISSLAATDMLAPVNVVPLIETLVASVLNVPKLEVLHLKDTEIYKADDFITIHIE